MSKVTGKPPRKASRDVRRRQLIEATIDVLATRGFSSLTVSDVSRAAGLSVGIVNFHFESKAILLAETLKYLVLQYKNNWMRAVAQAGDGPAQKLYAMTSSDFHEDICTLRTLQAWVSFWAEAQSRPAFDEMYGKEEAEYLKTLEKLCDQVEAFSGKANALVINALTDGLWLALAQTPQGLSRDEALRALHACLAAFYPAHFNRDGPIN